MNGDDARLAGVEDDLSAGLRALAARGGEPSLVEREVASQRTDVGGPRSSSPPLPSLSRPLVESQRRPPTPAGLAVADRILAAAGGRAAGQAPVISLVSEPPPLVRSGPPQRPIGGPNHRQDIAGAGDTLLPRVATVESPGREAFVLSEGDHLVIGRAPGRGGLSVDHLEVSRAHVRVELRLGQLLATDLGSTNGTCVVSESASNELDAFVSSPLAEGDRLVVSGDVVLCTVLRLGAGR